VGPDVGQLIPALAEKPWTVSVFFGSEQVYLLSAEYLPQQ